MRFETKIAVVVRDDLQIWQKLNVTAFLASGIAANEPDTIGEPYRDATGAGYCALFRQPVTILAAGAGEIHDAFLRARARHLVCAIYTDQMFATGHDAANRETVLAVATDDLALAGLAVYGPRNGVDRALKGLALHG